MDPQSCQESDPNALPEVTDLNLPIVVRKGVRTCTRHLISNFVSYTHLSVSNFVSYRHLSPSLQAFVSRLLGAEITKNIQEALRDLK